MNDIPLAGLTPDRPRRWPYVLVGGVVLLALVIALSSGGGQGHYGARAGVYALTADDLAAMGRWGPSAGPVDFGRVFAAAGAVPGVTMPDDRHVAAFRSADGSAEVFQVTLLYDDTAEAEALVGSGAIASLSSAFGLTSEPWALVGDGAVDARRWQGAGVEALSFRVAGAVVFVGATGASAAPIVEIAAAPIRDRLVAAPPATSTRSAP